MTKRTTVSELETLLEVIGTDFGKLEARLDKASRCMAAQMKRIEQLEAQETKTRKQLWYLQKVAKGEFDGSQSKAA